LPPPKTPSQKGGRQSVGGGEELSTGGLAVIAPMLPTGPASEPSAKVPFQSEAQEHVAPESAKKKKRPVSRSSKVGTLSPVAPAKEN